MSAEIIFRLVEHDVRVSGYGERIRRCETADSRSYYCYSHRSGTDTRMSEICTPVKNRERSESRCILMRKNGDRKSGRGGSRCSERTLLCPRTSYLLLSGTWKLYWREREKQVEYYSTDSFGRSDGLDFHKMIVLTALILVHFPLVAAV